MLSNFTLMSFFKFACILSIATVILTLILKKVTRGRYIWITKRGGEYWGIRNQSATEQISISKFINNSEVSLEWAYSAQVYFNIASKKSVEVNIVLVPSEMTSLALLPHDSIRLKAVPHSTFSKTFDLIATTVHKF